MSEYWVSRDRNDVAVQVGGEEAYLSPDEARELADEMRRLADKIEAQPFVEPERPKPEPVSPEHLVKQRAIWEQAFNRFHKASRQWGDDIERGLRLSRGL